MAKLTNCEGEQWYGCCRRVGDEWMRVVSSITDGIVRSEVIPWEEYCRLPWSLTCNYNSPLFQRIRDLGYQPIANNITVQEAMISECLLESDGKPIEYFDDLIRKRAKGLTAARAQRIKWRNAELYRRFPETVIGLDKDIDVYNSGFSVRILLKTGMTKDEKRLFVKDNKKDLIRATMHDITRLRSFKSQIGSLSYYKPCEIIILNVEELEVKFEVKREVSA